MPPAPCRYHRRPLAHSRSAGHERGVKHAMREIIYLDNNATTRVAPEVREAIEPYLTELYGNPSSAHTVGRAVRRGLGRAREQAAEPLNAGDTSEIVFTSCGSESDNWAIRGVLEQQPEKRHLITTRVEHEAVRNLCER